MIIAITISVVIYVISGILVFLYEKDEGSDFLEALICGILGGIILPLLFIIILTLFIILLLVELSPILIICGTLIYIFG